MKKDNIIPIMLCHDNNYVIPSAVAIHSLLEKANRDIFYKIYVLHSDVTQRNQKKLYKEVTKFNNASIKFINIGNRFDNLFSKTRAKAHYSKEMYYKLIACSIFPQYDKLVITDVDVVFLGDISKSYTEFVYLAGVKMLNKMDFFLKNYEKNFSKKEQWLINQGIGAGYLILNLNKIRECELETNFLDFLKNNTNRLVQPEQDILNLCSDGKIKFLHLKYMTCSYMYDKYHLDDLQDEENFSKKELKEAYENPIQLHYATHIKPWNDRSCTKSEIWFKYLIKTNFKIDFIIKKLKSILFFKGDNYI